MNHTLLKFASLLCGDKYLYVFVLQIQDVLEKATCDSNSQVGSIFQVLHTKESPPTYFQANKFTSAFQEIVDAYGWVPN